MKRRVFENRLETPVKTYLSAHVINQKSVHRILLVNVKRCNNLASLQKFIAASKHPLRIKTGSVPFRRPFTKRSFDGFTQS